MTFSTLHALTLLMFTAEHCYLLKGSAAGGAKKKPVAGKGKKPEAKEEPLERELPVCLDSL